MKKYMLDYYQRNRDKLIKQQAERYHNNKSKATEYQRLKRKNNIQYRLGCSLRSRLYTALRKNSKKGSAVRDLGCSIPEFKKYIEGQFKDGMSWENWAFHGWHLDHKIPLVFFDLTEREQLLKAVHYTNLQPLWSKENFTKSKKIKPYV